MAAIARVVSINAKLVIMDEPTSSLDKAEVQVLFWIIRQLKEKGIGVIFISHKLDEIFEICDRLTVFKDGEYVGEFAVKPQKDRVVALTEYGGYTYPMEGHKAYKKVFGYQHYHSREESTANYRRLWEEEIYPNLEKGLS